MAANFAKSNDAASGLLVLHECHFGGLPFPLTFIYLRKVRSGTCALASARWPNTCINTIRNTDSHRAPRTRPLQYLLLAPSNYRRRLPSPRAAALRHTTALLVGSLKTCGCRASPGYFLALPCLSPKIVCLSPPPSLSHTPADTRRTLRCHVWQHGMWQLRSIGTKE